MTRMRACFLFSIPFFAVAVSGCSKGEEGSAAPASEERAAHIEIKGSDTMVHLVSSWAEAFMAAHPDLGIAVTGGGSGTGIAALINGTTDLAAASREMKPQELELAEQAGLQPREFAVARDGIAVIVHPENPVDQLTLEQLKKIFTGAYANWKQVGGNDEKIFLLSRESSSGTYVFFQEHVLEKQDYAAHARLMPASSSILQSVTSDKTAIGYVGLGYAENAGDRVKVLKIAKDADSPAIAPSTETVNSGEYSISRPLYIYAPHEPTGTAKAFIDFALSPEGQAIVREAGYIAVR